MRRVRHELLSLLGILALPIAIALVFPYGAVGFSMPPASAPKSCAAIVRLSPEATAEAVRKARTAWQSESSGASRMRTFFRLGELPRSDAEASFCGLDVGLGRVEMPRFESLTPGWLPSQAAPSPARLPAGEVVKPAPAFSKAEMLKLF